MRRAETLIEKKVQHMQDTNILYGKAYFSVVEKILWQLFHLPAFLSNLFSLVAHVSCQSKNVNLSECSKNCNYWAEPKT